MSNDLQEVKIQENKLENNPPTEIGGMSKEQASLFMSQLVESIENSLKGEPLSPQNILQICIACMQRASSFTCKGTDKKGLVLQVLEQFSTQYNLSPEFVSMLPGFVETALNLEAGKITIVQAGVETAVGCCFAFCSKPKSKPSKK